MIPINNKPIHFGVYNNNKISLQTPNNTCQISPNTALIAVTKLDNKPSSQFWSCHHMQHCTVSILHLLWLIIKDFFINESQIDNRSSPKPIVIKNTAKISIVHTINNWHASCTWNFKNPLASTYSFFTKVPEQVTNFKPNQISPNKVLIQKS